MRSLLYIGNEEGSPAAFIFVPLASRAAALVNYYSFPALQSIGNFQTQLYSI